MKKNTDHVLEELQEHLPYTILSVSVGVAILGILTFMAELLGASMVKPSHELFHVFHPLHMLFSAAATTAMFWRHERKLLKAAIIGFVGAVGVCGISDIFIPYLSGLLLKVEMELHICIIKHPLMVLPFTVTGICLGLIVSAETHKSTVFSHTGHVLVSSMASILYLVAFGLTDWIHVIGMVFFYIVLAVVVPCCTSDIIFPLLLTDRESNA
jgi:uncharacterized membrane protein